MWIRTLALAACMAILQGCSGSNDLSGSPERRLTEYISLSFSVDGTDDRPKLERYLTGEALERFRSWSEEEFKTALVASKREFGKISFQETKRISDSEVNLTYVLTYFDRSKGEGAKVTNKKLCHMVRGEDGYWYIRDVRNIKEMIEYRNEMSLP